MAPEKQILTVISNEDKSEEIQTRLRDQETQKAIRLLALASNHSFAFNYTKKLIEEQLKAINGKGTNGKRK